MPKGRKPIPVGIKLLKGNTGKRRPAEGVPSPPAAEPKCPTILKGEARREWKRIVPELLACKILSLPDRAALTAYCQCWGRWYAAEKTRDEKGDYEFGEKGARKAPWVTVAHAEIEAMRKYLVEFGLTPSSRVRLGRPEAGKKADPLDEFLAGKAKQTG